MIVRKVSFPESEETDRLFKNIERIIETDKSGKTSFSSLTRDALYSHIDKKIRFSQSRIDTFKPQIEEKINPSTSEENKHLLKTDFEYLTGDLGLDIEQALERLRNRYSKKEVEVYEREGKPQ